jgi:hypothetical protein
MRERNNIDHIVVKAVGAAQPSYLVRCASLGFNYYSIVTGCGNPTFN